MPKSVPSHGAVVGIRGEESLPTKASETSATLDKSHARNSDRSLYHSICDQGARWWGPMKDRLASAQTRSFSDDSVFGNIVEQRIIRPETIPDFVIPPSVDNIRQRRFETHGTSEKEVKEEVEEEEEEEEELNWDPFLWRRLPKLCNDPLDPEFSTNADPKSAAALSLYHLRTVSSYAFDTLSELPSVIKNESFFFSKNENKQSPCVPLGNTKRKVPRRRLQSSDSEASTSEFVVGKTQAPSTWRSHVRRNGSNLSNRSTASGHSVLSGYSSGQSSHGSYQPVYRSNSSIRRPVQHLVAPLGILRTDSLRSTCSELSTSQNYLSRFMSPITDSEIEDTSDNWDDLYLSARRRSSFPTENDNNGNLTDSKTSTQSCNTPEILINNRKADDAVYGEVKIQVTYDYKKTQLYFHLIRADNMVYMDTPPKAIFAKVALMPGATQRQRSRSLKPVSSPTFYQTFVFKNILLEDLKEMSVRVRFYGTMGRLKGASVLSETRVHLSSVRPYVDLRTWMCLRPKAYDTSLGKLRLSITLYPPQQRVAITVHETQDVQRLDSKIPPDQYVRIEMDGPKVKTQKTETVVSKRTLNPTFQHTFCFQYSPKVDDILDTRITITVLSKRLFGKDMPLGQIRLGLGATEESEFQHWNCVLQKPFSCVTMWHTLMEPD